MIMKYIAAIFLALALGVFCNPTLPDLPNDFQVVIEANILNRNYSLQFVEYHDYSNNRARFEFYDHDTAYIEIFRYDLDEWYEVHNDNCSIRTISSLNQTGPGQAVGGHLRNASQFFQFGDDMNETYIGVSNVRGVPCDHWIASFEGVFHRGGIGFEMNYTIEYFFTVEEWQVRGLNEHRIPMRAVLKGFRHTKNDTTGDVIEVHPFEHNYEFVHFVGGAVAEPGYLFEKPHECGGGINTVPAGTCPGTTGAPADTTPAGTTGVPADTDPDDQESDKDDDDDNNDDRTRVGIGAFLGGLILGGIITAAVLLLIYRRRRGNWAGSSSAGAVQLDDQ